MDESFWHGVFWNHLVYPELSSDDIDDPSRTVAKIHSESMSGRFPDFVVCLCLDDYHRLPAEDRQLALDAVRQAVTTVMPEEQRRLLGFAHGNSVYWCGISAENERPHLVARLNALRERVRETQSFSITIGVAFLPQGTMYSWQRTAQLAVVAQRTKVRLGGDQVFVYDENTMSPSPFSMVYWRQGEALCGLVRSGDESRVPSVMQEVSHALFAARYLGLIHLRPILQSLVVLMAQGAAEVGVDSSQMASESERYLSEIATTYDYVRLRELLEEAAARFTADVRARFASSANQLASLADSFIKEHLRDPDLGLRMLSQELSTNSSYLCRSFKKAKGIGVVEYVNRLRVEEAKRRLLDRSCSVTDIAFELGFGTIQHFGRVFRTITDCSPSEYRSKHVQERSTLL